MGWHISSAAANEGIKGALNHLLLLVGLGLEALSLPAQVVSSLVVAKCME